VGEGEITPSNAPQHHDPSDAAPTNEATTPEEEKPETVTTASTDNPLMEAPAQAVDAIETTVEESAASVKEEQVENPLESETPAPIEPSTTSNVGDATVAESEAAAASNSESLMSGNAATEDGEHEAASSPFDDAANNPPEQPTPSDTEVKNENVPVVHTEEDVLAGDVVDVESGVIQDGQDEAVSSTDTVAQHGGESETVLDGLIIAGQSGVATRDGAHDSVAEVQADEPGPSEDVEEAGLSEHVLEAVAPENTGTPEPQQPGMFSFSICSLSPYFSVASYPRVFFVDLCMCQRGGALWMLHRGLPDWILSCISLGTFCNTCLPAHHSPPILSPHQRISLSWPRAPTHARNLQKSWRA
jgi:hypothetical protein